METDLKKRLGERLCKFRTENGYAQSHIGNVLGIDRSTYSYYETGKTVPVVFDLMRLADLYSTTLDDLLGFHADGDPLAFGDPRQPVKASIRRKKKERYLNEVIQDLSSEERQLLAYFRSAKPSERKQVLDFFHANRSKDQKRCP